MPNAAARTFEMRYKLDGQPGRRCFKHVTAESESAAIEIIRRDHSAFDIYAQEVPAIAVSK